VYKTTVGGFILLRYVSNQPRMRLFAVYKTHSKSACTKNRSYL